jgi:hypothetical protein
MRAIEARNQSVYGEQVVNRLVPEGTDWEFSMRTVTQPSRRVPSQVERLARVRMICSPPQFEHRTSHQKLG